MASISKTTSGSYRVQFFNADGKRQSVFLGKITKHAAQTVAVRIDALVAAKMSGSPVDPETARWVASRETAMYERLAEVGLVPRREAATLGLFLDAYSALRADVKAGTLLAYSNVRRNLVDYFGESKPLRKITAGDADAWQLHLINVEKLGENTVRRRGSIARQFFRHAQRKGLIDANPFDEVGGSVRANKARQYFITPAEAQAVLAACPDLEWRLLFALSRYGGLRCPSEHFGLTWADVDWERNRFLVRSPKTEHHVGCESRWVPIFPELKPLLAEAFESAAEGTIFIINRSRDTNTNLRTSLGRIIHRAGLKPWPKRWHNLRATRQTELAATYPLHVVCAWLGNKAAVAAEHYLQVTDDDYERAAKSVCTTCAVNHENNETTGNDTKQPEHGIPVLLGESQSFPIVPFYKVGPEGLEPTTKGL